MNIYIPDHVREKLNASPNASPRNTIIVSKISDTIYFARWNLMPEVVELETCWEINVDKTQK